MEVKEWLRKCLNCTFEDMDRLYSSQIGLDFLLVWNIYEVEVFDKFCRRDNLRQVAIEISRSPKVDILQKHIEYFHLRYQSDKTKYRSLKNGEAFAQIPDNVVANPLDNSLIEDRIHFLLFVLLRYRNNMFHGNKGISNWLLYREPIRLCTEAMCKMVEIYKEIKLVKT